MSRFGLPGPTRLLVSVARIDEISDALSGGAPVLDVKEPTRGSLGAADPEVVRAARAAAPAGIVVSAALGDALPAGVGGAAALASLAAELVRAGAGVLKIGLARAGSRSRVLAGLRELRARMAGAGVLPTPLVAAAFADETGEGLVAARDLPGLACDAGLDGAMLDTLGKQRSLLEACGRDELSAWVADVRRHGLLAGLAGGLSIPELGCIAALGPDVVGVRGAICAGGRDGRIVAARVRRAIRALRAGLSAEPAGKAAVSERPWR